MLRGIGSQFEKGDAARVNVEPPLSTLGSPTPGKDYAFEGSPRVANALAVVGIDLVTGGQQPLGGRRTGSPGLVDAVLTPRGVRATLAVVYVSNSDIPAVQKGSDATTILSLMRQCSQALGTDVAIKGDVATVRAGRK